MRLKYARCPACDGAGMIEDKERLVVCPKCGGDGAILKDEGEESENERAAKN